jgi:hypothetical protein
VLKTYPRFFDSTRFTVGLDPVMMGPGVGGVGPAAEITASALALPDEGPTKSKSTVYVPDTSGTKVNISSTPSFPTKSVAIFPDCKKYKSCTS